MAGTQNELSLDRELESKHILARTDDKGTVEKRKDREEDKKEACPH